MEAWGSKVVPLADTSFCSCSLNIQGVCLLRTSREGAEGGLVGAGLVFSPPRRSRDGDQGHGGQLDPCARAATGLNRQQATFLEIILDSN